MNERAAKMNHECGARVVSTNHKCCGGTAVLRAGNSCAGAV